MTRRWTETLAAIADVCPISLVVLALVVLGVVSGLMLYFWPDWLPKRRAGRQRARRWRWRHRRKRATVERVELTEPEPVDDGLPAMPAPAFVSLADRYAAEGRYPEAVRERLRAIIRDLVDRGVVDHAPGATVVELANAATLARPALAEPVTRASGIFSDIWYGSLPATGEHDDRMRELTDTVGRTLASEPVVRASGGQR